MNENDCTCHIVARATNGLCSVNPSQWFKLSCNHNFILYGLNNTPVTCPICGKVVKKKE